MARSLLAASPHVAQALVAVLVLATGWVLVRARARPAVPSGDVLDRRSELLLLALVLAVALLTRLVGWSSGLTAPYWFAETTPLHVAKALQQGGLWAQWTRLLTLYQVYWTHESAEVVPVAVLFQLVFGPSINLPVLLGAFYGVASVLLAWAIGRAAHSRPVGLLFASFVAVSPLQIVWSRHGGFYIAAGTHVLLVLLVAYLAGKRRSPLLAVLAAVCVWATLYNYHAARVAILLGPVALLAGLQHARASLGRAALVLLTTFATLGLIYLWARPAGLLATAWPVYTGYVGNKGEHDLAELLSRNVLPALREVSRALPRYFLHDRAGLEPSLWFRWAADSGGLCLAPVGLLGLVGLAVVLRRIGREWLWLVLAGLGLAIPVLSASTARRFLVFDLGWCALAAHGLGAILASRPLGPTPRATGVLATAALLVLGGWSFATVATLNGKLEDRHGQRIPFGESGFDDGLACKRCLRAGYEWQREIEQNRFVVLFDSDLEREVRTIPGGLPLYGELAALTAGRPRNFLLFYPVVTNFNLEPPDVGVFYDGTRTDFAAYLLGRLAAAEPAVVVWHFERPTEWERWVIGRLEAAGGTVSTFPTALSASPGVQVRTPWPLTREVRAVLDELARPFRAPQGCPGLRQVQLDRPGFVPLHLSAGGAKDGAGLPDWLVASWFKVAYRGWTIDTPFAGAYRDGSYRNDHPVASSVEQIGGGSARLHLLSHWGSVLAYDTASRTASGAPALVFPNEVGFDCAVRIGPHWWSVDPTSGEVWTTDRTAPWIPRGGWTGIGTDGSDHLVLASAGQWIGVYDVARKVEVRRFPAAVSPSLRVSTGECAPVLVGDGWYGTFDNLTSVLTVYDAEGREVGTRRLDRFIELHDKPIVNRITAIAAEGRYVAVGIYYDEVVRTIEVKLGECRDG